MIILFITILCVLLVGCANKSRQQAAGNAPIPAKDSIYHLPDQYPEYPGGMKKLMEQIENSIQYPEGARKKGVEGRVIVQFFVDENGKVIERQVLKSVKPYLNNIQCRFFLNLKKRSRRKRKTAQYLNQPFWACSRCRRIFHPENA